MITLSTPSLLVALPSMTDPQFSRSVVLLLQHGREGASGYIVNKPMPMALRDASFQSRFKIPSHIPVWMGGPVSMQAGVVLHNQGRDVSATHSFGDMRVSVSEEAIDGLLDFADEELASETIRRGVLNYRFVVGQASWEPKQLENELKAGLWVQKPMDEKLVFATPWQEIWPHAFDELGIHPIDIKPSVQTYLN